MDMQDKVGLSYCHLKQKTVSCFLSFLGGHILDIFDTGGFDQMKRVPLFSFLVLVLVSVACAGSAPEPTPTVTPEPPTATLLPTETATPKPTATSTPDRAATAAVEATQIAGDVQAELGELLGDSGIPYEEGKLAWQQSERMEVNLRGPDGRFLPFAEGVKGKNFIVKSDVTWNATGILVCGVIFRSEPNFRDGDQYNFSLLFCLLLLRFIINQKQKDKTCSHSSSSFLSVSWAELRSGFRVRSPA
jgi:hypothetical protein